ncbi:MAG TPA: bifunctional phosphoglucose/phosphomannose isomerase [Acidimicrobiia bacterium]|jgi:glucose/mannose-6-phosphate isomerase
MSFEEMARMVAGFGDQLRWAATASIEAPVEAPPGHVLIAGMGGSGISGDLVGALAEVPVTVHKSYGLPAWAGSVQPLFLALSYSGNTEETLSAVETAVGTGLRPVVVTGGGRLAGLAGENGWQVVTVPSGLQPRAALGYLFGAVVRVLGAAGVVDEAEAGLRAAADQADQISGESGNGWELAADLAEGLDGRIVGIYGSTGLTAGAAQRWKTQINENAKWPAWFSLFPELDHNEVVSWTSLADLTRRATGIVSLRDRDEPPAVGARYRHTEAITGKDVRWVGEVWSQGESRLERLVSLVAMGDLVSLELARRAAVDPVPVEAIESLKQLLAKESTT